MFYGNCQNCFPNFTQQFANFPESFSEYLLKFISELVSWKRRLPFSHFLITIIFRMYWLSLQYITISSIGLIFSPISLIFLDQQRRKMMEAVANELYHIQNPSKFLIILYFWKFSLASFMHQSFNRGEIL